MPLLFGSADAIRSSEISRAVKAGRVRKLAPKIYSDDLTSPPQDIIHRHRLEIVAHFHAGAVISHRSAIEGGVSPRGKLHVTLPGAPAIRVLPGLEIRVWQGPEAQPDDIPMSFGEANRLFTASQARALLENVQISRARTGDEPKTLSAEELERWLDRQIRIFGTAWIEETRTRATELAHRFGWTWEAEELAALLGALRGTRPGYRLATEAARSRAQGKPFDPERLALFRNLHGRLAAERFNELPRPPASELDLRSFWEAYFSNFIEGTKFTVEEAQAIVSDLSAAPLVTHGRPKDAHDIRETYRLIFDPNISAELPQNTSHLIELLKRRHARLMASRPEMQPGLFKTKNNNFGSRTFVAPELVEETLARGWPLGRDLPSATARALYALFLVAEVHPFNDGNGRISRLCMNAELAAAGQARLILPTSARIDYLAVLEALTQRDDPEPFIAFGHMLAKWNSPMPFGSFAGSHDYFRHTGALDDAPATLGLAALAESVKPVVEAPEVVAARLSKRLREKDRPSQLALFKRHAEPLRAQLYRHTQQWREKLGDFRLVDPPQPSLHWAIAGSDDLDVRYSVALQQVHHPAHIVIAYQIRAAESQCRVFRATFKGLPRTETLAEGKPWVAVASFDATRPVPGFAPVLTDLDSALVEAMEELVRLIESGAAD